MQVEIYEFVLKKMKKVNQLIMRIVPLTVAVYFVNGLLAGPCKTDPLVLNWAPWQGQTSLFAALLYSTVQP